MKYKVNVYLMVRRGMEGQMTSINQISSFAKPEGKGAPLPLVKPRA